MKRVINKHMFKFKPSRNAFCHLFGKGDKAVFNKGFTLVEVIVTIMAMAILGVIFMNFMGTAMSKSTRAVEIVQGEAGAEALLECIVADYVFKMNQNSANALSGLISAINNKSICGLNNPATPGVTTAYIAFDAGGNEIPPGGLNRTLKVTVTAAGNDLITLLTSSRDANSPPVAF
jgi:prepilin-type N-terminal cleavage/methylation domain-containing protein